MPDPASETTTQRWAVDDDDRPGMEWNRHIVVEDNPDIRGIMYQPPSRQFHENVSAAPHD